jgi:hypothetical protein
MVNEATIADKVTSVDVAHRIYNIFQANIHYLKDTDAEKAYNVYDAIANPSMNDLNTLRESLNKYKDALDGAADSFEAVNNVLVAVENTIMSGQVGFVIPHANLRSEHINGLEVSNISKDLIEKIIDVTTVEGYATEIANSFSALGATSTDSLISVLTEDIKNGKSSSDIESAVVDLTSRLKAISFSGTTEEKAAQLAEVIIDGTYIANGNEEADRTTVKTALVSYSDSDVFVTGASAFGDNDFSKVSATDDNSASGLIGNEPLVEVNYLGTNTAAPGSLSEAHKTYNEALESAIGVVSIAPSTPITFTMCTKAKGNKGKFSLGDVVYTTKDDISAKLNAISACGIESLGKKNLYYSVDKTTDGCQGPVKANMFAGECISYFHPDSDSE